MVSVEYHGACARYKEQIKKNMVNEINMSVAGRDLCLSKRVKNYWHKSGSYLSLKVWARSVEDQNVRSWIKMKTISVVKKK